jgi:murein DD-endopeptidase MepM/ murein hydrolase activator NlpD
MFQRRNIIPAISSLLIITAIFCFITTTSRADTIDQIQKQIEKRNQDIANLEKEIKSYQNQIDDLGQQANSLKSAIKSLDLTRKKFETDIKITENKIENKNYEISNLNSQIHSKEDDISDDKRIIDNVFKEIYKTDNNSLIEKVLSNNSIAETLSSMEKLNSLQGRLYDRINTLNNIKLDLEANKKASEKAKNDLIALKNELNNQRDLVKSATNEKNQLLNETKQSEAEYQRILANKQELKQSIEKEILDFESQLKIMIDTSKLPKTGSGVLSWPLDAVTITQYFGNTDFATANAQVYNGKGHNGIDLRASVGTPVKSALLGTVVGVGNTGTVRTCYSYGKWVLIQHPNGLSTLYAHLSLQSVSEGQSVSTGQIIGYSGNTGYTTGPHLHFGVYASQGIEVVKLTNSRNCRGVRLPVADFKAYLNPLSYL